MRVILVTSLSYDSYGFVIVGGRLHRIVAAERLTRRGTEEKEACIWYDAVCIIVMVGLQHGLEKESDGVGLFLV